MIAVTGAAGFIGSNTCRALACGHQADVIAIDDLDKAAKLRNLAGIPLRDVISRGDFDCMLQRGDRWLGNVEAVIHLGACTDTRQANPGYMFSVNTLFSRVLLDACLSHRVPFLYASSAAVYGLERHFAEDPVNERPRSLYAWSKATFDWHVRKVITGANIPITGLRFFNVYGPGEWHKGPMASLIFQLHRQVVQEASVSLYGNVPSCADGEQRRDFIAVSDAVLVMLWFLEHSGISGIFNVGTGTAISFNDVARLVLNQHGRGVISYVPLPASLHSSYQILTLADLRALRAAGYARTMTDPTVGIPAYLMQLSASQDAPATVADTRPAGIPRR